ncbi:hypothetical protein [Hyphomonas sp.]|uniref:hypothetical protein n=1 Tax=Hyphomonas sp. TaxID=87 RepID=UPI003242A287
MSRAIQLHRVRNLSGHFARNLAYYRARLHDGVLLTPDSQFWRTSHGNCLDICTLEWCKLFGSSRELYSWRKVVTDVAAFEMSLLNELEITGADLASYVGEMRTFRDKFIAHLDEENIMNIPNYDLAWKSVKFYFAHVTNVEIPSANIEVHDDFSLEEYYQKHFDEAATLYRSLPN